MRRTLLGFVAVVSLAGCGTTSNDAGANDAGVDEHSTCEAVAVQWTAGSTTQACAPEGTFCTMGCEWCRCYDSGWGCGYYPCPIDPVAAKDAAAE